MDPRFFRKYLDIINEAEAPSPPGQGRTGSQQDIEKMMGNVGVSPEELAARQAQDAATPEQTPLQVAQQRGAEVAALQKGGADQKTIDMYANGDLEGLSNQAAGAVKGLPSKAELQKMATQGMASKQFAALPKDQQDAYKAQFAQLDQMPDDYREKASQNLKQFGTIGAQDKAERKAGTGIYDPKLMQPMQANIDQRYTEKEVNDLMNNQLNPGYQAKADVVNTITKPATPVTPQPTAPAAPTANTQAAPQTTAPTTTPAAPVTPKPTATPAAPTAPTGATPQQKPVTPPATTTPATPPKPVQEDDDDELQKLKEFLNKRY
jgi:hypothetical protein